MLKMARYLKPHAAAILGVVVFLFAQATGELMLPQYMSRIVDVGVARRGIEYDYPEVMRAETYRKLISEIPWPGDRNFAASVYSESAGNTFTMTAKLAKIDKERLAEILRPYETGSDGSAVSFITEEYAAAGVNIDYIRNRYLLMSGLKMAAIALLSAGCVIIGAMLAARVTAGAAGRLRADLFRKVINFSAENLDKFPSSTLITRCTNDIQQLQQTLMLTLRLVLFAPVMGIGGVIMVLRSEASMSWLVALSVGCILALIVAVLIRAMPRFKLVQKLLDKLNLTLRESLTGIMVVRAFGTQAREEERFGAANKELTDTNLFVNRAMMSVLLPMMMLVMNLTPVGILWFGAPKVGAGVIAIGDLMAFIQYATIIMFSFIMLSMISMFMPRAFVALGRVSEVLDEPASLSDQENPKRVDLTSCTVEFRDVSFKYPGSEEYAVENIFFTARPGTVTAFIGGTGSGKSTIVNLLPRLYDVSGGEILINGADARELRQADLRRAIGYVPQKSLLFSGTIESNLRYGSPDASDEDMERAARIAQAGFIEEKPDKYGEHISQGGGNVSGGQRQRLSIARAIAPGPSVFIFDESFSALDYKTEASLKKAVREELKNTTVFIVASRISTIRNADQIIVLDEGKIAGAGTHDELIQNCEVYAQIAASQLSPDEM